MANRGSLTLGLEGDREVLTVTALNRLVRQLIEDALGTLWVEGEISNLARPSSGHIYFSLKDANAQVRCAMFRQSTRRLGFEPDNGLQVLVRARVGLYEPRGEYQLVVEHMEPAGAGALRQRFEALKAKLAAEGLFDAERKRPLPKVPSRIGVITSPTGAALRDVLIALRRRLPAVEVLIYPTGEIVYQYLTMNAVTKNSATIGMQNATKNDGLQVVFNANYVKNDLAIRFRPPSARRRSALKPTRGRWRPSARRCAPGRAAAAGAAPKPTGP